MDLGLSAEQSALQDALREFLEKESPPPVVRAAEPLGFDPGLWQKVVDLGLVGIGIRSELGGGGGSLTDLAVAAEMFGRYLAPAPLIEAAAANQLLASLSADSRSRAGALLDRAVAGDALATLAVRPPVDQAARSVPAGAVAELVVALHDGDLLLVHRPDVGPTMPAEPIANLGSLPVGDCRLDVPTAAVIASGTEAVTAYERAVSLWQALTAASLVGLGFRALEIGVDYVLQRKAFGVTIANFQTIQHRLADDVTALDGARLLAYEAAWALDESLPNANQLSTMAFLFASDWAFKTAAESLHFHGGYGYTLEYDVQLYFRRAKAWPLIAGDPRGRHADLAHRMFDRAAV